MESPRRRQGTADEALCCSSLFKVLCCVSSSRDEDGSQGDTPNAHDSPLVVHSTASTPGHSPPSSFASHTKFRAATPPPFEGTPPGSGVGGDGRGTHTDRGDDMSAQHWAIPWSPNDRSETSQESTSDGEDTRDSDTGKHETRKLLGSDHTFRSDSSAMLRKDTNDPEISPRRKSFDGGSLEKNINQKNRKPSHHRAGSEPPVSGRVARYTPPVDVDQVRLQCSGGTETGQTETATDGENFFASHLRKTLSMGKIAGKKAHHTRNVSGMSTTSTLADDDCCPTCFEGYDSENPKMPLQCGHHFHLGCVYEWYERSNKCPVCEVPMEFHPSTGWSLEDT